MLLSVYLTITKETISANLPKYYSLNNSELIYAAI